MRNLKVDSENILKRKGSQTPTKIVKAEEDLPSIYDNPVVKNRLAEMGVGLLEWQNFILRNALSFKNGALYYKNVCLSVSRQNGKTQIIIARGFIGLIFLGEKMVYSSYREESANEIFYRFLDLIENAPLEIQKYFPFLPSRKSKEKIIRSVDPITGKVLGQIRFLTRKGGAGRGLSETVIFIDEAQNLTEGENDSLSGTIATFKSGQIYYFGTPPPVESSASLGTSSQKNEKYSVFGKIRAKILNKEIKYSFWAEWGIEKMVPKTDRNAWYRTNPSLGFHFDAGKGLSEEYLASRVSDDISFAVEHLGFWSSQEKNAVIDATIWEDLKLSKDDILSFKSGKVSLALKSNTTDSKLFAVAAIRKRGSKEIFVEVMKVFDLTLAWENELWDFLAGYVSSNKCSKIIIDGSAASAQIKNILIHNRKWIPSGNRYAQGKVSFAAPSDLSLACAQLVGSVKEKNIFHSGQKLLDSAVFDAGKRVFRSGSGFGFYSISLKTDAAVVEAVALAFAESSKQKIENINENTAGFSKFGEFKKFV